MISKIISGAQTGADLAGLKAAKRLGLETGGWMPLGFFNQTGNHPEYAEIYGVEQTNTPKYAPRTAMNVKNSDGTVRFAGYWDSAGEILTLKLIRQYRKPWFDIDLYEPEPYHKFREWLELFKIKTLNVAGNSERTCPGIEARVYSYLTEALNAR